MESNRKEGLEPAKLIGKRRHKQEAIETPKPLRRSARLGERNLNQESQSINRAPRPHLQSAKIRASRKPKQLQPQRQRIKRQNGKATPIGADKPPQKDGAQESVQSISHLQSKTIKNWIIACAQMAEREDMLPRPSEDMPQSTRDFLSQSQSRSTTAISFSNARRPSFIAAHQKKFRTILDSHNIHIQYDDAPSQIIKRAREIILPPNSSFEMDDVTAKDMERTVIKNMEKDEDVFVREVGLRLFPAMSNIPDQRLANETNKLWNQAVAIPPDTVPLLIQRKLPRPKPDLAFGYSGAAFKKNQNMAIGLLSTEDDKSYAKPFETLRFPFLQLEFKSVSTGNRNVAQNQVANGGAIAMRGLLELYRRILAEKDINMDIPQFFSLCLDQEVVRVNAHWLSCSPDSIKIGFHMVEIEQYFLPCSKSLKIVHQIVKNILDYGLRERLPRICEALDKYYQDFILERAKTAIHRRDSESQAEEESIPPRQLDDASSDQRPARRRKLGRPAREDITEGSVDRPAAQLQPRRAKRATTKNTTQLVWLKERVCVDRPAAQLQPRRAKRATTKNTTQLVWLKERVSSVRASSRIADVARKDLPEQQVT